MKSRWIFLLAFAVAMLTSFNGEARAADNLFAADRCIRASVSSVAPEAPCIGSPRAPASVGEWLWAVEVPSEGAQTVLIRTSRFESAAVEFRFADGTTNRQEVRSGDFEDHWRIGGTLLFRPPESTSKLVSVAVGFRKAHMPSLLTARLVAERQEISSDLRSMLIGSSLALLLLSTLANLGVGVGLRRREPLWNAAWAACVLAWALVWTQVVLYVAPWLAGTPSSRLVTAFSTGAIACAGGYLLATAPTSLVRARQFLAGCTVTISFLGLCAAVAPAAWLAPVAAALNIAVLVAASAVLLVCTLGWKDKASGVRPFAYSFAVPIIAVLWGLFSDRGLTADDTSGMYLVLLACSLQTIWLAVATAKRVWVVRKQRDAALASEARMASIAETDPLTGLLNRRGFVGRAEEMIANRREFSLIVLDLDRFKLINDTLGHEAGDDVLCEVAEMLQGLREISSLVVGRLGGEEFGIGVEMDRARALLFAERLRLRLANHPIAVGATNIGVTASFGIAPAVEGSNWASVYRAADQALYRAKDAGRNRVEVVEQPFSQAA